MMMNILAFAAGMIAGMMLTTLLVASRNDEEM